MAFLLILHFLLTYWVYFGKTQEQELCQAVNCNFERKTNTDCGLSITGFIQRRHGYERAHNKGKYYLYSKLKNTGASVEILSKEFNVAEKSHIVFDYFLMGDEAEIEVCNVDHGEIRDANGQPLFRCDLVAVIPYDDVPQENQHWKIAETIVLPNVPNNKIRIRAKKTGSSKTPIRVGIADIRLTNAANQPIFC